MEPFTYFSCEGGQASQIEELCLDMWPAYLKGIRDAFPAADVTFDKFHVIKLLNEAVDIGAGRNNASDRN